MPKFNFWGFCASGRDRILLKKSLIGDGFCDDYNNIEGCDWDGGDCCYSQHVQSGLYRGLYWNTYCNECECLDPLAPTCPNAIQMNDSFCQDANNNYLNAVGTAETAVTPITLTGMHSVWNVNA